MKKNSVSLLRKNLIFRRFWIGQSISMFGTQITVIALPLTAVYLLNATPAEMGIFQAVATAPFFIFGLFAGVWVDNKRRRPLLIFSNLLTALFLALVPLGVWLNFLNITMLYIVLFLAASSSLIFELAYLSFIPTLIKREELAEGNSKLEISRSLAQVAGPGIAGWLISIITAPFAIIIDTICYLISALFISSIHVEEPNPKKVENTNIWIQIGEGLKVIITHPILRSISASTATLNFCRTMFDTAFMLFIVKQLHLTPSQIGLVLGIGSCGALCGALFASKWSQRFGIGSSIIGACIMVTIGGILVPIATKPLFLALPLLILGQAFIGFGNTVYFVNQVSLRQAITPNHILGRVNASNRFISRGAMPLGGLAGGALGTWFGVQETIFIAAIGYLLSIALLYFSPVRKIRTLSDIETDKTPALG